MRVPGKIPSTPDGIILFVGGGGGVSEAYYSASVCGARTVFFRIRAPCLQKYRLFTTG